MARTTASCRSKPADICSANCRTRNCTSSPAPATRRLFRKGLSARGKCRCSAMDNAPAIDKRRLRESFDKAAGGYDAAAVLQLEVCRRMLSRLEFIKLKPNAILDAGCGTGNVLPDFYARFP